MWISDANRNLQLMHSRGMPWHEMQFKRAGSIVVMTDYRRICEMLKWFVFRCLELYADDLTHELTGGSFIRMPHHSTILASGNADGMLHQNPSFFNINFGNFGFCVTVLRFVLYMVTEDAAQPAI